MAKRNKIILIVLVVLVLAIGGYFAYLRYQSQRPALSGPSGDISQIIENQANNQPENNNQSNTSTTKPAVAKNSTEFPLKLPKDFGISIFAKGLGKPRDLIFDTKGTLLVSIPERGQVVALVDSNNDGSADSAPAVISGLKQPHGLAFEGNKLYIAETDKVQIYDYDGTTRKATNGKKLFDLPSGSSHWSRSLLIAPYNGQTKLFVSSGSSCNVCEEQDSRRAAVWWANLDGTDFKSFAQGLRNSVFMAINPITGKIYATDNGRDRIDDDLPPEEVNILEEGKNYGWPICYGQNIHDTDFDKKTYIQNPCNDKVKPLAEMQAHSAPLGLAFVPEEGWPEEYWNDLIVAFHGSWNRSIPTGYKLVRVKLDNKGNYEGQEDFVTGWLQGTKSLGRVVDVLTVPGGTMYVSDDSAGVVYKLQYAK